MRLRRLTGRAALGCAVTLALLALPGCEVDRLELVVDDPGTGGDASVGDEVCEATAGVGDCTLRAAIDEANATPSADLVTVAAGITPAPGGPLVVSDSLVLDGDGAVVGDRVVHEAGRLTLRDLTITGVTGATTCGGAVASTGASVHLDRVVLRANSTGAPRGGGVCATGDVVVNDSSIRDNRVTGSGAGGGGIEVMGTLVLARSEVADNRLPTGSLVSQVAVTGTGRVEVLHSTITTGQFSPTVAAVTAPGAAGRITASTLRGTVALNPGVQLGASVLGPCSGGPASVGHNVMTDASCARIGTDRLVTDPALAGLDVPQAWSPVLDAVPAGTPGLCPGPLATDRRGVDRPLHGACDIGAVELESRVRSSALTSVGTGLGAALRAQAVNDAGVVAGGAYAGDYFNPRAAIWAPGGSGTLLTTDPSLAMGISPGGTVVGRHQPAGGTTRAFRWDPAVGTVQDLGTLPGDTHAEAVDANDAGVVVGNSSGPSGSRAWVWTPGAPTLTPLPSLGGTTTHVAAVNADGTAVGYGDLPGGGPRRAVAWDLAAGTTTDIGAGAAPDGSWAVDIDDDGVVIGTVSRPDLGEDCEDPDFGIPACPFSQPFRWDPATGELTQIQGLLGPVTAVAFGPEGTIVEKVGRYVFGCAGCPRTSAEAHLYDPTTGEHTRIAPGDFAPADANAAGRIVGLGLEGNRPGDFIYVGKQLTVGLAG